jgi:hypothetical protein
MTAGIALLTAGALTIAPLAATPPDVRIENPSVQLSASPFDAYQRLYDDSRDNLAGLLSLALAPTPDLPFTIGDFLAQALEVQTNIAAFRQLVSGLSGQVDGLNQLTQLFLQAASQQLQAGNYTDTLDILLYTALFDGSGVLAFALYPAALLGPDAEQLTPEIAGAMLNAVVAPPLSGIAVSGQIVQDLVDAATAGNS